MDNKGPTTPPTGDRRELEQRFLEHSLGQYVQARRGFARDVKVVLVLLVLELGFAVRLHPMAAEEVGTEAAYAEARAAAEGVDVAANRLQHAVTNGYELWVERASERVVAAQVRVVQLDGCVGWLLAPGATGAPETSGPQAEAFAACLQDAFPDGCGQRLDPADQPERMVDVCIVQWLQDELERAWEELVVAPFEAGAVALDEAIGHAEETFDRHRAMGLSYTDQSFVFPAAEVQGIRDVIASRESYPRPETWWAEYGGETGTVRSFRDNLLYDFSVGHNVAFVESEPRTPASSDSGASVEPQAPTASSGRGTRQRAVATGPNDDVTRLLAGQAGKSLEIHDKLWTLAEATRLAVQRILQRIDDALAALETNIGSAMDDVEGALPDYAAPLLAVTRPKLIVLGLPVAMAGAAIYLLASFGSVQRRTGQLAAACRAREGLLAKDVRETCVAAYPAVTFFALAVLPILAISTSIWWIYQQPDLGTHAPYPIYAAAFLLYLAGAVITGISLCVWRLRQRAA